MNRTEMSRKMDDMSSDLQAAILFLMQGIEDNESMTEMVYRRKEVDHELKNLRRFIRDILDDFMDYSPEDKRIILDCFGTVHGMILEFQIFKDEDSGFNPLIQLNAIMGMALDLGMFR
jgi:hypothetical protein